MQALRQIHTIKNHTITIKLPKDFSAEQVEVIILPASVENATQGDVSDTVVDPLLLSLDVSQLTKAQHHAYKRTQALLQRGRQADEPRILGLFAGLAQVSTDFDAPLPDEDIFSGAETDEYGVSLKK